MRRQKGAALLFTIVAIAFCSILVGVVMHMNSNSIEENAIFEKQKARNKIGRSVAVNIVNPSFIRASIDPSVNKPGNNMLRTCMGLDSSGARLTNADAHACSVPDPVRGMEFVLYPEPGYVLGPNCPPPFNPNNISCFIAGSPSGGTGRASYVAYSLVGGQTGPWSRDFPLTAKAYFLPTCPNNQSSCPFAKNIRFRFNLEETFPDPSNKPGARFKLGSYPLNVTSSWIAANTFDIVGSQCNPGAVAIATEEGSLVCQCLPPAKPLLDATGLALINNQGPVCDVVKALKVMCPPGKILMGYDANNQPLCKSTVATASSTGTIQFDSYDYGTKFSCNQNGNGGWVSSINRSCNGNIQIYPIFAIGPDNFAIETALELQLAALQVVFSAAPYGAWLAIQTFWQVEVAFLCFLWTLNIFSGNHCTLYYPPGSFVVKSSMRHSGGWYQGYAPVVNCKTTLSCSAPVMAP